MKHITRKYVKRKGEEYKEVLNKEIHHNHPIVQDDNGVLRWEKNKAVAHLVDNHMDLNHITRLFQLLGYGKNSEVWRKLYRDLGVSLYMYWEVFYWEINNPYKDDYRRVIEKVPGKAKWIEKFF